MPREIRVKSVLNAKKQRDEWFLDDYTFNPYSSCAFNCLYCYIRGSKYGQNLEKSLSVKINAPELLEKQLRLRSQKGDHGIIVISSATDPYLKLEEQYEITRRSLEIILKYRFPVHMVTKSDLILRDLDLLQEIANAAILPPDVRGLHTGAILTFSFSGLRDDVAKIFEPGAPAPSRRLNAVEKCLDAGFLTGISAMPFLPFITDTKAELNYFFSTFQKLGVHYLMPSTITLFGNEKADSKTLMLRAVRKHYPELADRYERYFATNTSLPAYYRDAFRGKMKELGEAHAIPWRIMDGAIQKYRKERS